MRVEKVIRGGIDRRFVDAGCSGFVNTWEITCFHWHRAWELDRFQSHMVKQSMEGTDR